VWQIKELAFFQTKLQKSSVQVQSAWDAPVFHVLPAGAESKAGKAPKAKSKAKAKAKAAAKAEETKGESNAASKSDAFSSVISAKQVLELIKLATPSLVGKGAETVHDEEVRKSLEIGGDRIQLSPDFLALVDKQVEAARQQLMHPIPLQAKLHKLIVYRPGDYFAEHIDALHEDSMVATMSVELSTETPPSELKALQGAGSSRAQLVGSSLL
jgi:hypothetical protein